MARCKTYAHACTDVTHVKGDTPPDRRGRVFRFCKTCHNKVQRDLRANDREKHRDYMREYSNKLRDEARAAYGNRCDCCGEDTSAFLAFDHVNDDGADARRAGKIGTAFYSWIRKNKYPDTIRLMCHNCNFGRYINGGICPHEYGKLNLVEMARGNSTAQHSAASSC